MINSIPNQVVTSNVPETKSNHCCDKIFGCACCRCLEKVSDAIIGTLEKGFYWLGYAIGRFPWAFILGVFVFFFIFIPGVFVNFYEETDPTNLWTPLGIKARDDKAWVEEHYQSTARFNGLIVEADNVLTAAVIKQMFAMDKKIKAIEEGDSYSWESLCAKLGTTCWSNSLLELWSFDENTINALTDSDVLTTVNTATVSPVYYKNYTVENVLGKITRDGNGDITGAEATTMTYFLDVNDAFDVPEDDPVYDFELEFIEIAQEDRSGITVYIFSGRSFGDEAGGAILGDINLLSAGYVIVIVFVCVAIGRFSCIHQKIYLTLGGILCIGLSIGFAMGLCAYASINWGPLHNVLPFLVLGIGVDDMFVIVQNWENLSPETHSKPIPERIALTMKHAGMSITVTSLTDILAFAVGSTTILPALRSFCIYSALCILACFLFQVLLFVACLAYDQMRAESSRNACCCCYVHKDYQPSKCSQRSLVVTFFEKFFAPFLVKLPVKIAVVLVALGVFAAGLYGTINMEQFFDAKWFIPSDSYLSDYFEKSEEYFPEGGLDVAVYTGHVDYFSRKSEMETLYTDIVNNQFTQSGSVDSWFQSFTSWLQDNSAAPTVASRIDSGTEYPSNSENFYTLLNIFLYNQTGYNGDGTRFVRDLIFSDGELDATRITFRQPFQTGTTEQIESMDSIRTVCDDTDLGDDNANCIVYSPEFLSFEGDKVIREELYRNLGLAFMCVVLMTLLLLANLWGCMLVSICVIISLVDVVGFMHFWGLTIDTVSTINLIIAIGLTVDYSAHIAHTFMTEVGDRNERVVSTLSYIGPAVFYGGFSTFLAFILLAASASYVFTTFFKIFLLVVVWGLFHGLMVLPVLLSWVGPPPYLSAVKHAKEGKSRRELGNGKVNTSNEDLQMEDSPPPKYEEYPDKGVANPGFEKESHANGIKATPAVGGTVTPTQVNV